MAGLVSREEGREAGFSGWTREEGREAGFNDWWVGRRGT